MEWMEDCGEMYQPNDFDDYDRQMEDEEYWWEREERHDRIFGRVPYGWHEY